MPRYKPQERHSLLLPVVLAEQIVPGSFAFALDYLVDHELDLTAMDAKFKNDAVGASAYDPRVMLKVVLLAYSQGLIGREMFAIDGVKLPSNASKERSGTFEELHHRADRLEKAADKIVALHQCQDNTSQEEPLEPKRQARIDALRQEATRTREFLVSSKPRLNRKGQELKTNITDPDSAKMATSKGVIQGYAAQAAVDSAHQVIVAADVIGSGSEQAMLLPMIEQSAAHRKEQSLITADAGYHSDANIQHLKDNHIPALIADKPDPLSEKTATGQPKEVKRFQPRDFRFNDDNTATCPAGSLMTSSGTIYLSARGLHYQMYAARAVECNACKLKGQCLRGPLKPNDGRGRQVTRFEPKVKDPSTPASACARQSTRPGAGGSTASAWVRSSRCLPTSGTTSA